MKTGALDPWIQMALVGLIGAEKLLEVLKLAGELKDEYENRI